MKRARNMKNMNTDSVRMLSWNEYQAGMVPARKRIEQRLYPALAFHPGPGAEQERHQRGKNLDKQVRVQDLVCAPGKGREQEREQDGILGVKRLAPGKKCRDNLCPARGSAPASNIDSCPLRAHPRVHCLRARDKGRGSKSQPRSSTHFPFSSSRLPRP